METKARTMARVASERSGQSSVEYALVLAAFLAAIIALGVVWQTVGSGGLQRLAEDSASHAVEGYAAPGGVHDIVLF